MKDSKHIDYVEKVGKAFCKEVGSEIDFEVLMKEHLSKVYQHAFKWKKAGIPFHQAVLLYIAVHSSEFKKKINAASLSNAITPESLVIDLYQDGRLRSIFNDLDKST